MERQPDRRFAKRIHIFQALVSMQDRDCHFCIRLPADAPADLNRAGVAMYRAFLLILSELYIGTMNRVTLRFLHKYKDAQSVIKGEVMKKQYLRILIALFSVAGFGLCAHGQTVDRISVKIPYEFVVSGKILPAGNYSVSRANETNGGTVLILSSFENSANMFVIPAQFESGPADRVFVTFEQIGEQIFLTSIQTGEHLFTIQVSSKEIMKAQAAAKAHMGSTTPATSTGNN
jgi:hypothetical protein